MVGRYSRRRCLSAIGATTLGATLAGCAGDRGDGRGGEATVRMTDDLTFEPETLAVSVGDTVTWRTVGSVGHTVTAYGDEIPPNASYFASGGFDSEDAARDAYPEGNVPGGESYDHTFETARTFAYFCIPHERAGMRGTINVADE